MVRILSTGTPMTIATTTGDAGQMGMVAAFVGNRIRRLICFGLALPGGDRRWDDCIGGTEGYDLGRDTARRLKPSLGVKGYGVKGYFAPGDRILGQHHFCLPCQHSVYHR
jgi:hypothetical protein